MASLRAAEEDATTAALRHEQALQESRNALAAEKDAHEHTVQESLKALAAEKDAHEQALQESLKALAAEKDAQAAAAMASLKDAQVSSHILSALYSYETQYVTMFNVSTHANIHKYNIRKNCPYWMQS